MSIAQAVAVAIHMLAEVKQRGQGVGGETQISAINSDGEIFEVTQDQVEEYESTANNLDLAWRTLFMHGFDLSLSQKQYQAAVEVVSRFLKCIRGPMVQSEVLRRANPSLTEEEVARLFRRSRPRVRLVSKRAQKDRPPSPE